MQPKHGGRGVQGVCLGCQVQIPLNLEIGSSRYRWYEWARCPLILQEFETKTVRLLRPKLRHIIFGLDIKSTRMARQKEILVKHFKIELVTVHSHKKWDWIKLDINYSTNEESGGTSTWWIADSISCFSPASCGGGTLLFQTSCLPFHMWHKCANYGSITHRPLTIACSIKLQFSIPSVEPG